MARSSRIKCPPGIFCISGGLGTILFIILLITSLFLLIAMFLKPNTHTIIMSPNQQKSPISHTIIPIKSGDSRYERAPEPLRDWMAPPEIYPNRGLPINIPTKGLPESFQSVGVINVDDKILPLYGRRTTGSSDRWNYYTRTDTYNPVPLPVHFQKRDCMDDVGCQELLSGEHVKIDGLHKEGKTKLYRYGGPKYIPELF